MLNVIPSFLDELRDFLLTLTREYGFEIDLLTMKRCLSCAQKITDVEEVVFRIQSLICKTPEQIDTFLQMFSTQVLHIRFQASDEADQEALRRRLVNAMDRSKNLQSQQITQEDALQRAQAHLNQLQDKLNSAEKLSKNNLEQWQALLNELSHKGVTGPIQDAVGKDLAKFLETEVWKDSTTVSTAIERTLDILSKKAVRGKVGQDLLKKALEVRVKDPGQYKKLLDQAKELSATPSLSASRQDTLKAMAEEAAKLEDNIRLSHDNSLRWQVESARDKVRNIKTQLQYIKAKSEDASRTCELLVQKVAQTESHRPEFLKDTNHNAVQTAKSEGEVDKLLDTGFHMLTRSQQQEISGYIRANARKFRDVMRRIDRTPLHRRLDIRRTIAAAARSGGEPLVLRYQKRKKSHARAVILSDISGSCREVTELALTYMGLMGECFHGGCHQFVFVDHLVNVDNFFCHQNVESAVRDVMERVPTRGIYSNYAQPIESLSKDWGSLFSKDTTFIIIGDARNNRNASNADLFHELAVRCKAVYWLNPDEPEKWGTGDSVIGSYMQAGAKAYHVSTPDQLISFLSAIQV